MNPFYDNYSIVKNIILLDVVASVFFCFGILGTADENEQIVILPTAFKI